MQLAIEATPLTGTPVASSARKARWIGRAVSALPVLFLLMDGIFKLFKPAIAVEKTLELGYRESVIVPLGIMLTALTILYIIPRTAVLGAILLTGYLGGAVATHVRVGESTFSMIFPVIVGSLLWLGLCLRDEQLRTIVPVRKS